MIEDFDQEHLERRRAFLNQRATVHLNAKINRRWHRATGATLLRDAAAIALIIGDLRGGRDLLRRSGDLFLGLGFVGGLQNLYIAGVLDTDAKMVRRRFDAFESAFFERSESPGKHGFSLETKDSFEEESFRPAQLLRAYQALVGRRSDDVRLPLQEAIRARLMVNATMPVGTARVALATYISTFDQLANLKQSGINAFPGGTEQVLRSIVQRRDELLTAARRDRFHWKALLRPAEMIDFDLLSLLLAGIRRRKSSGLIATAFDGRGDVVALPYTLANALQARR